jgi:carbon starvation protein
MNTFPILLGTLCVFALAYRYYSAFIAAKVLALDDSRITPSHAYEDGHNYVPSPKWVLFGHHFAAIAGAGPLVGPTLAAQFGFAPGFLWILIGAVFCGCVHDFTVLVASVRHKGRSLADVARTEVGQYAGLVTMIALLFILLVTLAGLGIVVVNALASSPWGVFTIAMTVPIAICMGLYMFKSSPGHIRIAGPSAVGVVLLIAAVIGGRWFAASSFAHALTFSGHQIVFFMMAYGFVASVLPVWFLLEPRDYLSTYMKLGTIVLLIIGVFIVHPNTIPCRNSVHSRRWPDHRRQAVSVPFCHHRLRRDFRISLPDRLGHNSKDAVEGKRRAFHRLRRDDVRRHRRRAGT